MVRKLALILAVFFALVVASGWVPAFVTETVMTPDGYERTMWGLFKMSLIDDITHGVTAIVLLLASLRSERGAVLALTAFGWYYACDAVFFLTYGLFNTKPWYADVALNAPHVIIAALMLYLASRSPASGRLFGRPQAA